MHIDFTELEDLKNLSEELFVEELNRLLESGEVTSCNCENCLLDVAAIVLNRVPPMYHVNELERYNPVGEFVWKEVDVREKIRKELPRAIALVQEHSRHEREEEA